MIKHIVRIFSFGLVAILSLVPSSVALAQGKTSTTQATPKTSQVYVALGDSVAAGLGLTPSNNGDPLCGRSTQAYPNTVAQTLNLKLSPATCSGAVTSDLYSKQTLSNSQTIPAQLDTAFANGTPQLITITVGANDIHWSSYVGKCLVSTCGTWSDTAVATISRVEMQAKLAYVFYQIGQRSHGTPPRVVVTGYYNPVSPACTAVMPQLTANEISWLTSQEQSLNRAIKNTSSLFSFVTFAPVDFTGHDICSTSSWVQSPSGAAPLHPTAAGQAVIAKSVLNTLGQ